MLKYNPDIITKYNEYKNKRTNIDIQRTNEDITSFKKKTNIYERESISPNNLRHYKEDRLKETDQIENNKRKKIAVYKIKNGEKIKVGEREEWVSLSKTKAETIFDKHKEEKTTEILEEIKKNGLQRKFEEIKSDTTDYYRSIDILDKQNKNIIDNIVKLTNNS